jgi:hypothetical protein
MEDWTDCIDRVCAREGVSVSPRGKLVALERMLALRIPPSTEMALWLLTAAEADLPQMPTRPEPKEWR